MSSNSQYSATGAPPFINKVLTRGAWSDYVHNYDFGPIKPNKLVLHHTYIPTLAQWDGLVSMKGMQKYYAGKGWPAGPHIYAAPDGIWLATPMEDVGVHANECNATYVGGKLVGYSIGLEMVGDYDHERPSGEVWLNALQVMSDISTVRGITPENLIGFHRECNPTKSCPGTSLTKEWVWGEVEAYQRRTQTRCLTPYWTLRDTLIYQGPSKDFPVVRSLSKDTVILSDGTNGAFAHMALVAPLQFDEGFVFLGDLSGQAI